MEKITEFLKKYWTLIRKNKSRSAGLLVGALAIVLLFLSGRPDPDAPTAWVVNPETGTETEFVSFSELSALIPELDGNDRVAISSKAMLIELRPEEGSEEPPMRYEADIASSATPLVLDAVERMDAEIFFITGEKRGLMSSLLVIFQLGFFVLMGFMVFYLLKSMRGGDNGGHALISPTDIKMGLKDVAGIDIARDEIHEVIELLKNPKLAAKYGARLPKGLLLSGPPGNGKTLLASAIAKEAGVSFLSIDASALNQLYMGMGALKVRRAFTLARKNAPCIVFMDEIDAMGRRGQGEGGVDQEKGATINALLTELDGITAANGLFLIGATNLPDRLDPALVRPGRIDRKLHVNLPDRSGRVDILKVHTKDITLADDVDLFAIAGSVPGASGAELSAMCNEAALAAMRDDRVEVTSADFAAARDRQLLGQSGSRVILDEKERRITAWHEAGHALVAALLPDSDPIERITIIPQGGALGFVMQVPDGDKHMETKSRLLGRLKILAAGRAAETIAFGEDNVTTGAGSDIEVLTRLATEMATRYGMGAGGFVNLANTPGLLQSPKVQRDIHNIAAKALADATDILVENRDRLDVLANELLLRDVIKGSELPELLALRSITSEDA